MARERRKYDQSEAEGQSEAKGASISTHTYQALDLAQIEKALRLEISGAQRLTEIFEKAKMVSQESLDFEVSL